MPSSLTRRQFIRKGASAAAGLAVLPMLNSCRWMPSGRPGTTVSPPKPLLDALRADDYVVAADAARLLGDLGSRGAVGPLLDYVTESPRYAKTAGLDALGRIGDPGACPRIRPLVREPNVYDDHYWFGRASVQVAAALALMELGDDSEAEFLMAGKEEADHRNWALFTWFGPTVMRLPDRSAEVRALKRRLTVEELLPDAKGDPGQLVVICNTVGMIGGENACARLAELLGHRSRYVRARAATNLLRASSAADHVERVTSVADDDPTVFARVKACQALCGRRRPGYLAPIARAVESATDPFDRAAALESLGVVGAGEYVPVIVAQLTDEDAYVRLCAVEALDRIGTRAAILAAESMCGDLSPRVRLHAEKCIAAHS